MRIAIILVLLVFSSGAFAQDYSSLSQERGLLSDSILSAPGLLYKKGDEAEAQREVELWLGRMPKITEAQSQCEESLPGGWKAFANDASKLIPLIEQRRDQFQLRKVAQPIIDALRVTKICALKAAAKELLDAMKMSAIFAGGN